MKRLLVFLLVFIPLLIGTQAYLDRKVFPRDWIGTYYEVPVSNGYRLVATNFDYGTIIDTDWVPVVDRIDSVQVTDNAVIGETASHYFLFQLNTGALFQYETMNQLRQGGNLDPVTFTTVIDHYWQHRRWTDILTSIACLMIALSSAYFTPSKRASN
ncbi:MAG: hypothetical protein IJV05_09995 [Muribaculaceae bacterium]|nr:hypothetical protein [Muribaculaceae bacterium]